MRDYDWGFGFGFGRGHPAHRPYGSEFGDRIRPGRGGAGRGYGGHSAYGNPRRRGGGGAPRYDRGIYGEDYPAFGGRTGGEPGMNYGGADRGGYHRSPMGGAPRGYDADAAWARGGGPRRGWNDRGPASGYQSSWAEAPFLPPAAYQRHPELDRPSPREGGFPGAGARAFGAPFLDDEELENAVRQSLYQDSWIDAERIDVEVQDAVVTLTGEVDDFMQARYAWDDVWETDGVRGVVNHLAVRADAPLEAPASQTPDSEGQSEDGAKSGA